MFQFKTALWIALAALVASVPSLASAGEGDAPRPGGADASVPRFIKRLDKDGDGRVSRAEFDGPKPRFGDFDKNGDGFIDAGEAPQGPRRGGGVDARRQARGKREGMALEVLTVGTGSPLYNPKRSSPSALIRYGGTHVLVDMGEGTAAQLTKGDITLNSIAAFCFTHHHRDHNADAMTILPKAWLRSTKTPVIGPKGTKDLVDFLWSFYEDDLGYRLRNRGIDIKTLAAPQVIELPHKGALDIAGLKVTTAEVPHTIETFAYRFDAGGQSIVVSGDLSYSEKLIGLAKGADVLVMDSGGIVYKGSASRSEDRPHGQRKGRKKGGARKKKGGGARKQREGKGESGPARAHASLEEVARMAAQAGVQQLVLVHFRPGEVDEDETRRRMRKIYEGTIHFAEDLQTFTARR